MAYVHSCCDEFRDLQISESYISIKTNSLRPVTVKASHPTWKLRQDTNWQTVLWAKYESGFTLSRFLKGFTFPTVVSCPSLRFRFMIMPSQSTRLSCLLAVGSVNSAEAGTLWAFQTIVATGAMWLMQPDGTSVCFYLHRESHVLSPCVCVSGRQNCKNSIMDFIEIWYAERPWLGREIIQVGRRWQWILAAIPFSFLFF